MGIHTLLPLPIHFLFLAQNYWKNAWVDQWKIQKDIYPADRLVKEVVIRELVNHFLLTPILTTVFAYPMFCMIFNVKLSGPLPSWPRFLAEIAFMILMNETGQYWVHRLLHAHPLLYKYIHAQHHRFVTPITFAAEYSNPIEMILSNDIPTFLGGWILGSHLCTMMIWTFARVLITIDAHSGYSFPWSPVARLKSIFVGPDGHDWHHSHNKGNYGILWFWDSICGTDKEYRKWLAQKEFEASSKVQNKEK